MKTKTEKQNKLLADWQLSDKNYANDFRLDGIIDEELFEKTNPKILFICKEPNGRNHSDQFKGNFCKEWRNEGAQ